jgi:branched-chain amino acid transport system permease protein
LICAALICAVAGALIGLPTLRLRGDYIAIVTLAFGEIIRVFAINGPAIKIDGMPLTGGEIGISGIDLPKLPLVGTFDQLHFRPWYYTIFVLVLITLFVNLRVRDSRLGRAWIALREDEVAAMSMGIPVVRTKLMAYALGAAFGGISGAFLASYTTLIDANQFQFGFSIFVLAMVIVGGLGSVWGVVFGALLLANINYYLIPDVLNSLPSKLGLNFSLSDLNVSIFGFLLVLVMVLRPPGLVPERRRRMELMEGIGETELEGSAT